MSTEEENGVWLKIKSFCMSLLNAERRKIRRSYPISGSSSTRCPKLDPVFKSQAVKADYKPHDGELARLQAFRRSTYPPRGSGQQASRGGGKGAWKNFM